MMIPNLLSIEYPYESFEIVSLQMLTLSIRTDVVNFPAIFLPSYFQSNRRLSPSLLLLLALLSRQSMYFSRYQKAAEMELHLYFMEIWVFGLFQELIAVGTDDTADDILFRSGKENVFRLVMQQHPEHSTEKRQETSRGTNAAHDAIVTAPLQKPSAIIS